MLKHLRELTVLGIALSAAPLLAHDLWIEPSSFSPLPGQAVSVRLRVGVDLVGDPLPLVPALVKQFVVTDAVERRPVAGRSGAEPAGAFRVGNPGLLVVGYHSLPSRVELAADKFNTYLAEEGLEAIIALRAQRGSTGTNARERFARCAKSLVLAGPPNQAQGDQRLGCPLELLAERNPYSLADGDELPFRLSYEDQPLAGALVVAMNSVNPAEKQAARTDADGRVRFRVRAGGLWLVKAVHMVPAPAGTDADWASFWASITFGRDSAKAE
jgi:Domain of unknown function (DUF4198)